MAAPSLREDFLAVSRVPSLRSRAARLLAPLPLLALLLAACGAPAGGPAGAPGGAPTGAKLGEVKLDYAYYSPTSLVLKKKGWAEEAFAPQGTSVKWVLSAGSNKANEFVRSNAVDFGSTAGAAALLERSNGTPLKTVYIYEQPEWTALVVGRDSPIADPRQLKGKKIAATKGTDPFFFLLRTLNANSLSQTDVEIVNVQHDQGRVALERGQVDAWAGLDPHMAASELEAGSRLLYRNRDFNTYGTLNTREDFLRDHPEAVRRVIEAYERARAWANDNQEETAKILAEEANISLDIARRQLFERINLRHNPVPGDEHVQALTPVARTLKDEQLVKEGAEPTAALQSLFDASIARQVVK